MNLTETTRIHCPYCGERIELVLDCSVVFQEYIEDCEVCCKPISVTVSVNVDDSISVKVCDENEV